MNNDVAIKVDGVSKSFKLPHEKSSSIKSALINFRKRDKGYEKQQVLDNVSFEIKKGEFFGIVGRNGSGKSTLLKLLSGIYTPDKGTITTNGKITPFIELGVGFNPELSGRENIFLNGALLGFNRKEMEAMYDDIVLFAELERFMDQKLKNYSSGMQVRLAFSIAIQAKSEILILDEVLAVGDEAFQKKCINVFESYKANKQTIVLVTHDMSVVERFCNRAMMLKEGNIVSMGTPRKVAKLYSDTNKEDYSKERSTEDAKKEQSTNIKVTLLDSNNLEKKTYTQGESLTVRLVWDRPDVCNVGVALMKRSGEYIFGPNTIGDKFTLKKNTTSIDYTINLNVASGEYFLKLGLFGDTAEKVLEFVDEGPTVIVESSQGNNWGGVTKLEHNWSESKK